MTAVCAVLVRNEQEDIAGWIAWHLGLGFDRVLVFDADSTDGTCRIVQAAAEVLPVELHQPELCGTGETRRLMLTKAAVAASENHEWLIILDADEYLDPGDSLRCLLSTAPSEADAIALNWCVFGLAGYEQRPYGHIVAKRFMRAPVDIPEHGYVRLIVRHERLGQITDPHLLGLRHPRILNPRGETIQWQGERAPVAWAGGRILHYASTHKRQNHQQEGGMAAFLVHRFDRNDFEDRAPARFLNDTYAVASQIHESCLVTTLRKLARAAAQVPSLPSPPEHDSTIPERQTTSELSYHRMRPSPAERALLSPSRLVANLQPQTYVFRDNDRNILMIGPDRTVIRVRMEESTEQPLLVGLVFPQGFITFFATDGQPVILGDVPCILGQVCLRFKKSTFPAHIRLPVLSGLGGEDFELMAVSLPRKPASLPLPEQDTPQGLSVNGLYEWAAHLERSPAALQHVLCLLSPGAARTLRQDYPELTPFIGRDY